MNFHLTLVCIFSLVLSIGNSNALKRKSPYTGSFLSRVNQFTAKFYEALAENEQGNFISSPISTLMVLGMAACGADGNTKQELIKTLNWTHTFNYKNYRKFISDLKDTSNNRNVELHLANKLFIDSNFYVKWLFSRITTDMFQSKIEEIDFKRTDNAANRINMWCSKQTNNKITNLVTADALNDAQLVMVNAVYFKGIWLHPFNKPSQNRLFHLSESNDVSIPMMCTSANYKNGQVPQVDATYIELPYDTINAQEGFSMYIILPNEINGLDAIGNQLHEIDFMTLNAEEEGIDFCMPKFKLESELDLIPTLQNMGLYDMFEDAADFSNISPNSNLKISKVIQKAFINVDEKGSEAAAATAGLIVFYMSNNVVTVDRPFIAAIVSKRTGTPLFWARINDPRP